MEIFTGLGPKISLVYYALRAFDDAFSQVMLKFKLLTDHSDHWVHLYSAGTNAASIGSLKNKNCSLIHVALKK